MESAEGGRGGSQKVMDEQQNSSNPHQPNMQAYSMQPGGQYNSNGHHSPDAYRASPSQQQSHALLPPIHNYEGSTMQSQPPYVPQSMNGAPMQHPPPYNPHQFQYPNGAMPPAPMPSNVAVNGQNGIMRYPIPPQAALPMGHARGAKNKEVKRRTKTGCLTCRKRRIKCDEAQPTCRNCAKSKRECMGYDPIFKQTTGPPPIQPAPASATTPTQKSAPSSATISSNSYQTFPGTGETLLQAQRSFTHSHDTPFEYGPSLDPALGPGESALTMAPNSYSSMLQPARQVKHISMDQLFSLNDVAPQYQQREAPLPGSLPPEKEIEAYYKFHYAVGLDRLFETAWYSTRGFSCLQRDQSLLDFMAQCMQRMMSQADDPASVNACKSLEARLVWKLATLPRSESSSSSAMNGATDQLTSELLRRVDTLEYLLTGQFLPESSIPPQGFKNDSAPGSPYTYWHELGSFTSIHDDTSNSDNHRDINHHLAILRQILGGYETRDVLYSIAIARYIGGRLPEYNPPNRVTARTDDPNDEVKKLQIAHDFVATEDVKGSSQVIQRVCGMALRSWMLQKQ